jgi:hypothetical protein
MSPEGPPLPQPTEDASKHNTSRGQTTLKRTISKIDGLSLKEEKRMRTEDPERQSAFLEVVTTERNAWRKVLGTNVKVTPLPANITPEVKLYMDLLGFKLRYIPKLNLDTLGELKLKGEEQLLKNLQVRYVNWRRYETLSPIERTDHSVKRNLEQWFWELAKNENMEFPKQSGTWIAVETVEKPPMGKSYDKTPAMEAMTLENYFNVSAENADQAIADKFLPWFSRQTGLHLKDIDARMLTAIEWNLLSNREGWGKTDTYEWTSTQALSYDGIYRRVIVGNSDSRRVPTTWTNTQTSSDDLGFRVAVVLKT